MNGDEGTSFPWELGLEPGTEPTDERDAAGGEAGLRSAEPPPAAAAAEPTAAAAAAEPGAAAAQPPQPGMETAPSAETGAPRPAAGTDRRAPLVRKEYYAISEVADIVGLPAHVLRYWESQFSVLNPSKNRSGNRVYQRKEIKLILLVKQLLHDEKYTVEGAKQRLDQLRRSGTMHDASARALDTQLVHSLRTELQELSELLAPGNA